ncbi:unnamed protein product [Sphagnum troendelagicum]|uniref:DNA 3'-5' helicase n=1 Tax=Sphagnum troendelagicum TaxID=128251 RepID=A0ABP0U918_9BRYO
MDPGHLDPDSLKSVSVLPSAFQRLFPFRYFNAVQSASFAETFLSDQNIVISAPTGSGKTILFELCILRLLTSFLTPEGDFNRVPGGLKTVYIAPTKALVQDKLRDWSLRFSFLGLKCQELTGDTNVSNVHELHDADVILTTPEKFDFVTRRHRDHGGLSFFADISLLLIDEVHLLSEPRGASLEAVISRMKMLARFPELKECPIARIRFIAVSATVPNIEDIAEWLKVSASGMKRFGEETRPVKLTTRVYGYAPAKNDFLFERRLQNFLYDVLMHHWQGRPSLVFCSTRRGAQEAAVTLAETALKLGTQNPFIKSQEQYQRLQDAANLTNERQLQQCINCGVAFHNGGLSLSDRNLVEGLFLKGDLQVLCTTNTLAHGVNLPAHSVIIKSTQYYNKEKGSYTEYERSTILQMSGRAGRPQFDDSGVVIIMTRRETVHLYQNLLSGSEPVESELLPSIVEHLNAEVVLLTVSDVGLAIDWLKCSFLYVRIKKNPQHYHIQAGVSSESLENKMKEICLQNVNELANYGMLQSDEFGFTLTPLEPGKIMAKYYLHFETMKAITNAPDRSTLENLLYVLANAKELSSIKLRRDEKKRLNSINSETSSRMRFHVTAPNGTIKKRIQTHVEKIFVLTNDVLSGEPSALDFSMSQDINCICTSGTRICRGMSDYFIFMKRYKEACNALTLGKCLKQRLWEKTSYPLKQLVGIGQVTAKALLKAGVDSFDKLAAADPRRLELITGRKYPFGNQVKSALDALPPRVDLKLFEVGFGKIECCLTRLSPANRSSKHIADLVVGNKEENRLLFHERIRYLSKETSIHLEDTTHQSRRSIKGGVCFQQLGIQLVNSKLYTAELNLQAITQIRSHLHAKLYVEVLGFVLCSP